MIWDCELSVTNGEPVILPCVFSSRLLAIELLASNKKDTWYRAGYLAPIVDIDSIGFRGSFIKIGFGSQLVEIPYKNYRLQFEAVEYLLNTSIKVKQLSENYLHV
jgi:hypothetical protein